MRKRIFLTGGGDNQNLDSFNDLFINTLEKNKIQYVYFVPFGKKRFLYEKDFQKLKGYFKRKTNIQFILITDVEQLTDIQNKADNVALFMAGGNVMRFINTIRGKEYYGILGKETTANQVLFGNPKQLNIEKNIKDFVNNGGIYYGTSAGALLAGKSLNTQMLETADEDKTDGLNLIDGQSVAPHYKENEYNFYNSQERELETIIIKLKDDEGIYYDKEIYKPSFQIKKQFINRQINHLRLVQDLMILLEINKDKLPFYIEDWALLNRGMKHDLDKFYEYLANDYAKIEECYSNKRNGISNELIDEKTLYDCSRIHYSMQSHHTEYHEKNNKEYSNVDICEMCCDIFSQSICNKSEDNGKKYCIEKLFPKTPSLDKYKDNIIYILDLLISFSESLCHFH